MDVIIAFNSVAEEIWVKNSTGFEVKIRGEENFVIEADKVINAAGLNAVDLVKISKGFHKRLFLKHIMPKDTISSLVGSIPLMAN